MMETVEDEQGNMYCKAHRREYCHVCCCDFRGQNAYMRDEITVDEIADYGEDTFFQAAQALGALLTMKPKEALGLRREAQARMLRRLGDGLEAATRARAEALMGQQVAQVVAEERRSREEEAARRAAVLASWEVEPLPAAAGGGGGAGGGGRPGSKKKNRKKKSKAKAKPASSAGAGAGGDGGGGAGGEATAAAEPKAGEAAAAAAVSSDTEEEEDATEATQAKEEPVDLMAQHDNDCGICLLSMAHTQAQAPTAALRCAHEFHRECLREWKAYCGAKRYAFRCPLCNDEASADMTFD